MGKTTYKMAFSKNHGGDGWQSEAKTDGLLELSCAYRGLRGRILLFCLGWLAIKKCYKYNHIGFALRAPDGTDDTFCLVDAF